MAYNPVRGAALFMAVATGVLVAALMPSIPLSEGWSYDGQGEYFLKYSLWTICATYEDPANSLAMPGSGNATAQPAPLPTTTQPTMQPSTQPTSGTVAKDQGSLHSHSGWHWCLSWDDARNGPRTTRAVSVGCSIAAAVLNVVGLLMLLRGRAPGAYVLSRMALTLTIVATSAWGYIHVDSFGGFQLAIGFWLLVSACCTNLIAVVCARRAAFNRIGYQRLAHQNSLRGANVQHTSQSTVVTHTVAQPMPAHVFGRYSSEPPPPAYQPPPAGYQGSQPGSYQGSRPSSYQASPPSSARPPQGGAAAAAAPGDKPPPYTAV